LEQEPHAVRKLHLIGEPAEDARRAHEDGRVPVVTAGVHAAVRPRLPAAVVLLNDREAVDVGSQGDGARAGAADERNGSSPARQSAAKGHATVRKRGADAGASALLLVADLGMGVQFAPEIDGARSLLRNELGQAVPKRCRNRRHAAIVA
jgi:hypothetical protein